MVGQSLTDWLWLIPTVTGLGLLSLALAAVPRGRAEDRPAAAAGAWFKRREEAHRALRDRGAARRAALSVIFLYLGDLYIRKARDEQGKSTTAQLSAARTAADFNPVSVIPLYLQASALEAEGNRDEARAKLQDALSKEPNNFVTLTLLGDLEVRASRFPAAADYYRRASDLNPLDVGLQQLAQTTAERASPLQTPDSQAAEEGLAGQAGQQPVPGVERPLAGEAFDDGVTAGVPQPAGALAVAREIAERGGQLVRTLRWHHHPAGRFLDQRRRLARGGEDQRPAGAHRLRDPGVAAGRAARPHDDAARAQRDPALPPGHRRAP